VDTLGFLRRIWPTVGHYCIDTKSPLKGGFKHHWFNTIEQAALGAVDLDERDYTVYHACAGFTTATNRKAENAGAVRSLWLDLDVGEVPQKFASLASAGASLKKFLLTTALPTPMVVSSGGGLHCYWTFTGDVDALVAHPVAAQVKALALALGFQIDPSRTADFASVLRPIGTHNRKFDTPRQVKLVRDAPDYDFTEFMERVALNVAEIPATLAVTNARRPRAKGANAIFEVPQTYPDSDPDKVADACAQIREFRDTGGVIPEPQWYTGIQVLHFCKGGDEKIHEWSKGHSGYAARETAAKIQQISDLGPASCATFGSRNPGACDGCPHRGSITGPIQLGVTYPELPAPVVDRVTQQDHIGIDRDDVGEDDQALTPPGDFIPPPRGFKRTPQGVVYRNKDGVETIIYPYDLYLDELTYDEAGRYEMSMIKHQLPQEGWLSFPFRSSDVASDKDFERAMRDNHVKPQSLPLLKLYLTLYMQELQRAKRIRRLYASMGWKEGTEYFVLGEKAFHRDGNVTRVGISPSIVSVARALRTRGDRQLWIDATAILGKKGMEAHAMAFSAGPGAILMKFTGFEGALFNTTGESNSGKTSIARFFTSMYGCFDEIKLRSKDTVNAKIGRIGVLSALPVYVDEVTNEAPEVVSEFIYEITQGRSKLRLRQDGTERDPAFWNTIVVSSSNTSLSAKLGLSKANPDAERLRLFEFPIHRQEAFQGEPASNLFRVCANNFGLVGPEYIQHVVTHQDEVRAGLEAMIAELRARTGARDEERMWIASIACGLYGLMLMQKLGLIVFDISKVAKWVLEQIKVSRETMDEERIDPMQLLGQYFNEKAGYRVALVRQGVLADGTEDWRIDHRPTGALFIRYEVNHHRIWVEQAHLRKYVTERQGDFPALMRHLTKTGALVRRIRKSLGAGTGITSAQVACFEFNTQAPGMADYFGSILQEVA
jgi:hypothetical protein